MNSIWLVIGALAAFAVAYRLYAAFLAAKVLMVDDKNITPAHRLNDGVDYHPTKKLVLFGHHFAAIAGPGPLIGPVLAAQWGYLPGFIWLVIGACLAGAVHDFVILVASVRQNGMTLPQIARKSLGPISGATTAVATLFIIVAVLASVAMVVVKALAHSSWGMFTILTTIPAAVLTGLWMYKIRPGKVGEASAIGVTIVLAGVFLGKPFADSAMGGELVFSEDALKFMLPAYAMIASILPVWVLMCPRDYLSSYMKIGVMVVLGVGILIAAPELKMPATTPFLSGGGPVVSGAVWPFVCVVIMCGALSGFHALIASGTTPKMINKETDTISIGYGAMVLEGFVALTALIAACALEPGDYFAINSTPEKYAAVVQSQAVAGWDLRPVELTQLEAQTEEKLEGRTGGAVTLAVGMAKVFSRLPGMGTLMAYWYHFVIMFEALFILTLLETGTRVARFVFQESLAQFRGDEPAALPEEAAAIGAAKVEPHGDGHHSEPVGKTNWTLNITMSVVVCGLWGGLLYIGNLDTLWRMLGIANQLLGAIALAVGTTYLLQNAPKRKYALVTAIPFVFVVATVFTAGIQSIQGWLAGAGTAAGTEEQFMLRLASVLAAVMLALSGVIVIDALRRWRTMLFGDSVVPAIAKP